MKDEIKSIFYTKKHYLIILAMLLVFAFIWWYFSSIIPPDLDSNYYYPYENFIDDIKPYDSQEELVELYEEAKKYLTPDVPGLVIDLDNTNQIFLVTVYSYCIKYNLPYDSLVEYSDEILQYNQFSYFNSISMQIGLFIFLACLIIGCFYHSRDLSSKIGKLVYTSGEKRNKIIANKYIASMLLIMITVLIADIIISLLALMYSDSGAKYCVIFTSDYVLYTLNYFEIVIMTIASHLLAVFCTYTFSFFISVILKNGVLPFAITMCLSIIVLYTASGTLSTFIAMIMNGGFIECLMQTNHITNINSVLLYIPILLVPIITAIISIPLTKNADFSR